MWKAPQARAASPSSTRAARQSTSRAASAPYAVARPGTEAMSGSSYWPMSAVYVHGTAPFSRIHAPATEVSRPPEKAMPTRSRTGREQSTLDMVASIYIALHEHAMQGSGAGGLGSGGDAADAGGGAGRAGRGVRIEGDADAGEQQAVDGLTEEGGHLAVVEGHPGRASAEGVGGQVQPAFGQPGGQVRVPVRRIAEASYGRGGDSDERRVAAQRLLQAHPVQFVPHRRLAHRSRQIGPAVHARGEAADVVHHHPVRQADTADGDAHAGAQQVL